MGVAAKISTPHCVKPLRKRVKTSVKRVKTLGIFDSRMFA